MARSLLALCFLLLLAQPGAASDAKLLPFDEAPQNPEFLAWRDALIAAVKRRDAEAVAAFAAPKILLSFGEDEGPETLVAWLNGSADWQGEAYWRELEEVLTHGGAFNQQGGFDAPYWFAAEPALPAEVDWMTVFYIIGDKVRLRAGPGTNHKVLAELSYDIVVADNPEHTLEDDADGRPWLYVRTFDGLEGWVALRYLRNGYSYRAGFEQQDGRWAMTYFLAGD